MILEIHAGYVDLNKNNWNSITFEVLKPSKGSRFTTNSIRF